MPNFRHKKTMDKGKNKKGTGNKVNGSDSQGKNGERAESSLQGWRDFLANWNRRSKATSKMAACASGGASGNNSNHPNKEKENHMESLVEIFRCFICMEKLRDARMCPRCSKLCCYGCIRRWLTETRPQCPHCRASLHIHELVNCRWAEEVTQQLDSLQQSQPSKKRSSALSLIETDMDSEKCSTHVREELSVYCNTCKCCICHECALWSTSHTGHVFKPLDEIYHQHCQQIKEQVSRLRRKFMEMMGGVQDLERHIDIVRALKDNRVREIRNAVELMIARLDTLLKSKLLNLVSQKGALTRKAEEVENLLREMELNLNGGPKSEVIKHSGKLLKMIQDAITQAAFVLPPIPVDFPSELVPPFDYIEYTAQNFSRLRAKADPFYSDPLKLNGLTWRLKVYPDGNGVVRGSYLSVFLELTNGPPESAKYDYRIEMQYVLAEDSSKNMVREFASDFEISECWGYNRFFRLDLLETEGFWEPTSDCLKLRFDVRNPTYYQKCKDQQWYINQLENSSSQQAMQIAELNSRIRSLEGDITTVTDDLNVTGNSIDAADDSVDDCDTPSNRTQQLLDLAENGDSEASTSDADSQSDVSEAEQDQKGVDDNQEEAAVEGEQAAGNENAVSEDAHAFFDPLNILPFDSANAEPYDPSSRGASANYFALLDELNFVTTPPRQASTGNLHESSSGSTVSSRSLEDNVIMDLVTLAYNEDQANGSGSGRSGSEVGKACGRGIIKKKAEIGPIGTGRSRGNVVSTNFEAVMDAIAAPAGLVGRQRTRNRSHVLRSPSPTFAKSEKQVTPKTRKE